MSLYYQYGGKSGKKRQLLESDEMIVVRTHNRNPLKTSDISKDLLVNVSSLESVVFFANAGVEVLRLQPGKRNVNERDQLRTQLKKEKNIRFSGRVLCDPVSKAPIIYTENFFVKFQDKCSKQEAKNILLKYGVTTKRELPYAGHAYFVNCPEGTGQKIFSIAQELLLHPKVELCHPELVQQTRNRSRVFPQQWHLAPVEINGKKINAHANVAEAWTLSTGENIIIAVIDDGVDTQHPEFKDKIVAPRDATLGRDDANPKSPHDAHGTSCAGVACASGKTGASGVAFASKLMPIRMVSGLGSQTEADAFIWATDHGADVISCSWGPSDGDWSNPNDPLHSTVVPLPDSSRMAIDYAVNKGRKGKGCVVVWAAGNGNESVDNDGYASYSKVIAVAACNDRNTKSCYSDLGKAIWCCFPSNQVDGTALTTGIWTTDRLGSSGYNKGQKKDGDEAGNYTNSFGGTSSACPGVAGVVGLMLAKNPNMKWQQVKEVIKKSCDRIDEANGRYDHSGHSTYYGYGKINAFLAVKNSA